MSARQIGMGGAWSALPDASGSIQSNPAGLSLLARPEARLAYAAAQSQSRHSFAAYAHPLLRNPQFQFGLGAGIHYFSAGNMDVNYTDGTTRSFNAETGYAGMLSAALRLHRWAAVGVTPKFVRSTLVEQFSVSAFAADVGFLLFPFPELFRERLTLGGAVRNLGSKVAYKSVQNDLPRLTAAGASLLVFDGGESGSLLVTTELEQAAGERQRYRLGGEYALGGESGERTFFVRGGYRIHFDEEDYSFGVGFQERNVRLDYAFVSSALLENTHRLSLGFRFGRAPSRREGLKYELIDLKKEMEEKFEPEMIEKESAPHKDPQDSLQNEDGKPAGYRLIPEGRKLSPRTPR